MHHQDLELARSETDVEDKYVDTRLLLQVLWAMMPEQIAPAHRQSMEARMRAYKNAAFCLQDFMEIADTRGTDKGNAARYDYFIEMAGPAWSEYLRWKIGRERNRLVHQDYGSFFLEKTAEEIFASYASALLFVEFIPKALRDYSKAILVEPSE